MSSLHDKFWPKRLPRHITPPATPLWDNVAVNARRFPDKPALVFLGRSTSYRELLAQVEQLAAKLYALGVRKGDRVLLNMQNCPQLVVAHFAILRANAVVVPVNPMNRAEELKHYITDPDAAVAITTADLAAELAKASNELPEAQRLKHLIVTRFTDAFDPAQPDGDALPPAWEPWLLAEHPAPPLAGGAVHSWQECLTGQGPAPAPMPVALTWRSCRTPAAPPVCPRGASTSIRA
jgi:fatty-acyl-CoA synthase